ncbi:hypothetical protein [Enterobacter hormaechei]|uniref:hypothetical protein n=1 Tax=Enterobacter hormaechei TaxID=158836 RepID=UPI0007B3B62D|nr:hypothetical protein [Enterobacter hormaechei]KZP56880.1 hypothetical protein A3N38_07330 [Enterobacter hormaechei subsp. steigerwaltii]
MTANKPMTGEQLDELMTIAVNMQRDSEKVSDRPAAMFAYAVQVAVLELRKVRNEAAALAAENAGLKAEHELALQYMDELRANFNMYKKFKCQSQSDVTTPATEAFLADVMAQGVEMFAKEMHADISGDDAREFAAQLRKGAAS